MATEVQAQANGNGQTTFSKDAPEFKSVHRVIAIPVVQDGLTTLESIVNSTQVTATAYGIAGAVASKSLNLATPLLIRSKGLVDTADGYANAGLDYVENKFPYPFKTSTGEMYTQASDSAKGIYDARLAPVLQNDILQKAIDSIYEVNKSLGGVAIAVKDRVVATSTDASAQAQALAQAIVDQLHLLSQKGAELPAGLKDNLSKSYTEIRGILAQKDKDTTHKAQEIAAYVQSIVQPEVEKTLAFLTSKKETAEKKGEELVTEAQKTVDETVEAAK